MRIHYPNDLPVSQRRDDLAAAIAKNQVVIVAGETGSGKTTQLPKICMELGRGRDKLIGHTQPRRIAARSVAERIAEETATELGNEVGYQVRFTDKTAKSTRLKVMTDGIVLAELGRDRHLNKYDTLIIDEAHERSLNIDFLLGYLKRLLPKRPDLKVVITSATIDVERFADHFRDQRGEPAPIIEVSGRTYPVEVRYRPLLEEIESDEEGEVVVRDQTEAIVDAVEELNREGAGDVLVFLPGEREIRDAEEALGALKAKQPIEILPLYSRLSAKEQHRVFKRGGSKRRVVLATNVAETSLTVPGIKYVVDTGVARISRYSTRSKVQRLPIEPISQASANQRSGRCGRIGPGIAIRLYSEEDFDGRPEFTDPEILRTNLASVLLQMASLRIGDIENFPFLEPPDRKAVNAGVQLLEELGALTGAGGLDGARPTGAGARPTGAGARPTGAGARPTGAGARPGGGGLRLTKVGSRLARLPLDPRMARMIIEAERRGVVRPVLVIVAALSLQDPRERPLEARAQADQKHARFTDRSSDFLAWLGLWNYLKTQQKDLSGSAFRRMCRSDYLNYLRVREWQDFESQLRQVCKEMRVDIGPPRDLNNADNFDADAIHQALLAGLLSHIGMWDPDRREYLGARGTKFNIFPGSGLFKKNPAFIMAAELVETSKLYARSNAVIKPEWAEALAPNLVKRQYAEPHWSRKRAAVMARERVTLYGVPLVADRPTPFHKIDPELSRELFIRHALVYGEWHTRHRFYADNRRLLEEAEQLEHRARRRDIVVDEHTLFDFYDQRLPAEAVSGVHFDTWWKQTRREQPDLLTFQPEMLTNDTIDEVAERDYPQSWRSESGEFTIGYHFEPGADDDGLTIDVPLAVLNRVTAADFSWNVPGLREELVTELIRSLPKAQRVHFVPAPNTAREFLAQAAPGEEPLTEALQRFLLARTGIVVEPDAWGWGKVAPHLRPAFRVIDENDDVVATGKDLEELKTPLRPAFAEAVAEAATTQGRTITGARTWDFDDIEESFIHTRAGHEVKGFPGLVDEGSAVGLRAFGSDSEAAAHHREGVRRLVALTVPAPTSAVLDGLDNSTKLALAGSPYPSAAALVEDCWLAVIGDAVDVRDPIRTPEAFTALTEELSKNATAATQGVLQDAVRVLGEHRDTDKALSGRVAMQVLPAMADMKAQVDALVGEGFIKAAGARQLRRVPVYLQGVRHRQGKLEERWQQDRQLMAEFEPLRDSWRHQVEALPEGQPLTEPLRRVRWLLEELRISLWATQLGTDGSVSAQRIRKVLT